MTIRCVRSSESRVGVREELMSCLGRYIQLVDLFCRDTHRDARACGAALRTSRDINVVACPRSLAIVAYMRVDRRAMHPLRCLQRVTPCRWGSEGAPGLSRKFDAPPKIILGMPGAERLDGILSRSARSPCGGVDHREGAGCCRPEHRVYFFLNLGC